MTARAQTTAEVSAAVWDYLGDTSATLPLPGNGQTGRRWEALWALSRQDVVVGRLVEAHADAQAILTELGAEPPRPGEWWGVWAAEPPKPVVLAHPSGTQGATPGSEVRSSKVRLEGAKAWCSGAGLCTHALVTARDPHDSERRLLCSVALDQPGVTVDHDSWHNPGMTRSATYTVRFDGVPAQLVAPGEAYLERAGFWHGGCGVAACWLGGAEAVADTLRNSPRKDPHTLAALGSVDAILAGCRWSLWGAAAEVDQAPDDIDAAKIRAMRVRTLIEAGARAVLDEVGRALGATPLALDADHARAVADLGVYIRQHHGAKDLAGLGELLRGQ